MKNLSFFDRIIYLLNSLLATLLILAYLLPFVSPKTIAFFTILSLFVPVLIVLNGLLVIYWVLKLKKQWMLSSLVLTIGFFCSTPFYKISDRSSSLNKDLKVMSYNVKSFDLFLTKKESEPTKNGFEFIASVNPYVLLIQEYYESSKIQLDFSYQYIRKKSKKGKFGMAIYSKFKIINSGSLDLKKTNNNIIFVDILKEKDTIRIYNLHLESLKIKPNEENFGDKNSKKLLDRVSTSFKKQADQTMLFLDHEKKWKGKKIIGGDFNNTAYSWVYNQIANNKKDTFIEAGKGFGKTYSYFLPTRIDFILTDNKADINSFKTYSVEYSDHYPILSKVNWD
jgi:endonuclease/exonuclease/phosphatase family metal-dependent hydrolase